MMPYKQWRQEEAIREGVTETAIWHRVERGCYPALVLARINARVIFVEDHHLPAPEAFRGHQRSPAHTGRGL